MPRNEYKELYRDNLRRCGNLQPADRQEIDEATSLLNKVSFSQYEIERVRQDLITMAERAEADGKTLAEALGPHRADLFDAMAREMEPGGFADYLCTLARPYLLSHAALVLLNTLFGTAGRQTLLLFAVLLLILPLGYLLKLAQRRIWLSGSPRRLRGPLFEGLCMVVAILLFLLIAPLHIGSLALSALAGNTATLLLFLLLPIFMLDGFAVSSMQRRIWIGQSPHQLRKGLGAILHIVFLLLLFSCAVWIEWTFPIKVPAWYYIALEICLYLAGRLCCRIRYNRAAARRPWR